MDPVKAAEQLGSGNAQVILAVVAVALAVALAWVTKAYFSCLLAQAESARKDTAAQIAASIAGTEALKDMRGAVDAMVKVVERLLDRGKA